ncbi:MAG TPA: DUF4123 domain-containing protein [Quisquiliibacterium sp.]|nr:DUF4123 domain-containing protein [Quisquiliibacterium sp.]
MAIDDGTLQQFESALWDEPGTGVVAILDGASVPGLRGQLRKAWPARVECLMGGYLEPDVAEVSPYAVELHKGSAFNRWLFDNMWGAHWGILVRSREPFGPVARHFRGLFIVQGPEHKPLYFRFYDPRALRLVLPTCSPQQVTSIFACARDIWMDAPAPGSIDIVSASADGVVSSRTTPAPGSPA